MADSMSKASGQGVTLELRGETFKILPLTIGDLSSFESFLRSRKIKDFMEAAKELDTTERVTILSALASQAVDESEIAKAMSTMTGVQYLLWRSLMKTKPELTFDDMDKYVDLDNFEEISTIVQGIGGSEENVENPPKKEAEKA